MRTKTQQVCQQCGATSPKWIGRCPSCQQWNTFVEERIEAGIVDAPASRDSLPIRFTEITGVEMPRFSTGIAEFDRVLGGGVVAGALVLIGGDPGVGKSTLMLDVASRLAESSAVLYASGEESAQQIKLRGDRLALRTADLHIYAEMSVEKILRAAEELAAKVVVIDSIQTTFSEKLDMAPGSIGQVREVASQLLFWTKKMHVPVFLIGHITKDGSIAGPKALEHIVDTVLYFEGPRQHPHRIIRTIKNRFGPANELGIFEMASSGLKPVEKPSGQRLNRNFRRGGAWRRDPARNLSGDPAEGSRQSWIQARNYSVTMRSAGITVCDRDRTSSGPPTDSGSGVRVATDISVHFYLSMIYNPRREWSYTSRQSK